MPPLPVDAVRRAVGRAFRLAIRPGDEWPAIGTEAPAARAALWSFVVPLTGLSAALWALNRGLQPLQGAQGDEEAAVDFAAGIGGGVTAFACLLLSILLLAGSVWLLAPLFDRPRDWSRSFMVASYSAAPLYLGSVVLLLPGLAFLLVLAVFQSAYLVYGGLHLVVGVREDRAAEYVALSTMLLILASTLLGGLGGALGVL